MRLGAMVPLMERDSIYKETVEALKEAGAHIVEFSPPIDIHLENFITLLNIDMKHDLPTYLEIHSNPNLVSVKSIADIVDFNKSDSLIRIPYGQALFEGIIADSTTTGELDHIKLDLEECGRTFFDTAMDAHDLDAILSINNYHAGYAAVAKYPALTIPMGYKPSGEPISLTFIGEPFSEAHLLRMGKTFENTFPIRKMPKDYQ
ncbi:hypothetical protein [Maribacter litopenaei]|uniref:hypothetical protein n=1 Tax=Maribacter litopenaei TaxID=2976127 RepID=UPI0030841DE7